MKNIMSNFNFKAQLLLVCIPWMEVQLAASEPITVSEMQVVLIDSVDVPASQDGAIAGISVDEGETVSVGDELARLDDRKMKLEQDLAQTRLEIANENAQSGLAAELAEKKLAQEMQLAKEHKFKKQIADRKAENDVSVQASKKAELVAENELSRAVNARRQFVDSVSESEIDNLRLSYERSVLETKQAEFERVIDALQAEAEAEAANSHQLGVERYTLELAQAKVEQRVQELQAELQGHQLQLAELASSLQTIKSPIDGVVVERFRNLGDWVKAGEPLVRVIRLDRLRAEGFISADQLDSIKVNQKVNLTIVRSEKSIVEREGVVKFISRELEPVSSEIRFWVEFDNASLDVLPGMRLSLSVSE
ncbi:HlyD family efflux transporter periplasmic adaptor subunit [Rubripirellula sp.]|nr:HlyD family efflux transporter periplasmic adaptor subunit [Rubripirellula sp.]MDB4749716.1 HlyD family efflux transporter periplasmic adaptor subunit [Rubripirellula sp.]